jgi:hypothetical protein
MVMAATAMVVQDSKSPLEKEHQRLGHLGVQKLMDLAKRGELDKTYEEYKHDPFPQHLLVRALYPSQVRQAPKGRRSSPPPRRGNGIEEKISDLMSISPVPSSHHWRIIETYSSPET